jgi:hydroxylaminobenzene mutase
MICAASAMINQFLGVSVPLIYKQRANDMSNNMNKKIIRHGFILIFIALISGLFIPTMAIPRLGLSSHTIGILGGVLLIAIGAIWAQFVLSGKQLTCLYYSWLYSSYMNWLGCLSGAILGAGTATPVASAGVTGSALSELIVSAMLVSVGVVSFVAVGLSLWGLSERAGTRSVVHD